VECERDIAKRLDGPLFRRITLSPNRKSECCITWANRVHVIALFVSGCLAASCSSENHPPSKVETTGRYESVVEVLTIGCAASNQTGCRMMLENRGNRRSIQLNARESKEVKGVAPDARTCALPSGNDVSSCSWVPVYLSQAEGL
jgi:hypothetical protein